MSFFVSSCIYFECPGSNNIYTYKFKDVVEGAKTLSKLNKNMFDFYGIARVFGEDEPGTNIPEDLWKTKTTENGECSFCACFIFQK